MDATQPKGRHYYWKSEYLPQIEPALCGLAIEHAALIWAPHSAIILFQVAGALNQLSEEHSPAGNRTARYILNITGACEQAVDDDANIASVRGVWTDMRSFSAGGNYINFLTADEGPERIQAALGTSVRRLAEVKARWDP